MYGLYEYGRMIADKGRMAAYENALRQAIKPGSVVLDIGTGTGIFALLACQLGAGRVYAIEPSDAIGVGREIAAANGYANTIEFIQDLSTRVTLPEWADVIVSDLRGVLPNYPGNIPAIIDARDRLLAPGGILIPIRDILWAALVHAPDLYNSFVQPWDQNGFGFDMRAARRFVANTWRKCRVSPDQLLVEPKCWATLDYTRLEGSDLRSEVTWTLDRTGTAHGLVIWFDSMLAEGVRLSNAPTEPELIYGSGFFPWCEPLMLALGDTVTVALEAHQVGQDYIWRWDTQVLTPCHPKHMKAQFKQSDFFGEPRSAPRLRKQAAGHVPTLNEDGLIDRFILTQMDGKTNLGDIASRVCVEFPKRFPTWQQALTRVGEIALGHSQ